MHLIGNFLVILGIICNAEMSPPQNQNPPPKPNPPPPQPNSPSSPPPVCPSDWQVIDQKFCMWMPPVARSWNDALAHCHSYQSHLLILHQDYYGNSVDMLDHIYSSVVNLISEYPGIDEMWTGVHVVYDPRRNRERLWWEADVPLPDRRDTSMDLYQWSHEEPNTAFGFCGAATNLSTLNPFYFQKIPMQMDNCNVEKRFICVRESIIPQIKENVTGCRFGWLGNIDLNVCYKTMNASVVSSDLAQSNCKGIGSQLAFPKDTFSVQFFMDIFADQVQGQSPVDVWIGRKMSSIEANSTLNGLPQKSCNNIRVNGDVCLYLRLQENRGYSFYCENCNSGISRAYVCEMNATSPGVPKAYVVERNVSLSIKPGASTATLTCNATNYHPSKEVVWVKDGFYFGNGLPPAGLTLDLYGNGVLKKINMTWNASLQGEYHCEVWGQRSEFSRVQEEDESIVPALVTSNDVATFRGTINLCYNISQSNLNQILSKFFGDKIHGINIDVDGPKWLSGATAYDFNAYYNYVIADERALRNFTNYLATSQSDISWQNLLNEKLFQSLAESINQLKVEYNGTMQQIETVQFLRTDACCEETVNRSTFLSAQFGSTVNSSQLCPLDLNRPKSIGKCNGDFIVGGSWSIMSLTDCPELPNSSSSVVTPRLRELSEIVINDTNVNTVIETTAQLTSVSELLSAVDVAYTAGILNDIGNRNRVNKSVALPFVQTVSNIASVPKDQLHAADSAVKKIISVVEKFTDNVDLDGHSNLSLSTSNIELQVWDTTVDRKVYAFVSYVNDSDSSMRNDLAPTIYDDVTGVDAVEGAIFLSDEALEVASRRQVLLRNALNWNENLRVSFLIYRDGSLFSNPSFVQMDSDAAITHNTKNIALNSYVISGIINRQKIENLTDPVKIILRPLVIPKTKQDSKCAYWDNDVTSGRWGWSTKGVWANWSNESSTWYCFSRHLTNFAIIAGFDGDPNSSVAIALKTVSIIGIALSIIGLSLTIIAQILFRAIAKGRSQLVLMNLAIALLAVDILVLVGVDRTDNYNGCIAVAALLLYFLLASFCWMLVEGVIQYLKFVKVFDTYTSRFMLKAALPAWGIPLVPVILVAAIDYRQFRDEAKHYCWLAPNAFHFAFLLPLGLIWLTNLILFIFIIKGITCDRPKGLQSNQKKRTMIALQVQAAICCAVVMGLTWLFCLLSVDGTVIAMDFLFCIFNSLQGFFIFIFANIREKPIRNAWLKLLRTCCSKCCLRKKTTVTKPEARDKIESKKWSRFSSENQDSSTDSGYNQSESSSSSTKGSSSVNSMELSPIESKLSGLESTTCLQTEHYNY